MSKVGIVILNYNGAKFQNDTIRTVLDMDYRDYEIVLVDNNSKDNSVALAMDAFGDRITLLQQSDNYGFAKGNNIGIQYCIDRGMEYVLLLNNDVEVHKSMLSELMEYANESTVVVPKTYFFEPGNMLWYAGGTMDWKKLESVHYGIGQIDDGSYDEVKEVTFASGCCMLVPTAVFKRIGMLDEILFMYWEDADFCARLMDAGCRIIYNPKAVLWHKVSSSSGGTDSRLSVYYMTRNKLYIMKKYKDKVSFGAKAFSLIKDVAKVILAPVRKRNDTVRIKGYRHYLAGRMGRCDDI